MESMARDVRHPYIPSTTVLGDTCMHVYVYALSDNDTLDTRATEYTIFIKLVCTHKTVNYAKPSAKFLDAGELHQAFSSFCPSPSYNTQANEKSSRFQKGA